MKAAYFTKFGPADEVLIVDSKSSQPLQNGEVLVQIFSSGVNPSDVKKRAGSFLTLLDNGYVIPHSDGAGIIKDVGLGVNKNRIGERVWVYQGQYARNFGTAAQYITIDAQRAVKLPDITSFDIGASLGIPMMTAHRCVFADGEVKGKTILITGGAGRVGYYAIQWAKLAGAKVIATASNETDTQSCLSVGADAVVNHRQQNWSDDVISANEGKPVDRVIDVEFGYNLKEVLKLIKTSGVIATYSSTQVPEPKLPFFDMMYKDITLRMIIVYAIPEEAKQHAINDINNVLKAEKFTHRIAATFDLGDIAKAHELIESGNCRGSVIVQPNN